VFALDSTRSEQGQPGVILLEPRTGESLIILANLETFHNDELQVRGEAALAISFYNRWLKSGGTAPRHGQCIGYRVPLFLSGVDDIDNLSLTDLTIHWHVSAQLIQQVHGLPPGTRIGNVTID
jgi:hypothetical protein